jgi:very-short-patch-repair endonuclease
MVIVDAALHAGLDPDELATRAGTSGGRRGSARARAVLGLADGGAESPWETACRFTLLRAGFPVPQTQIPVETRLGTFWADLGWEEWRVLLEYDGRTKYAGREVEEFVREKRRHDAVVEAGWRMVHVTREDLRATGVFTSRVAALLPRVVTAQLRPRRELG